MDILRSHIGLYILIAHIIKETYGGVDFGFTGISLYLIMEQ